MVSDSSAQHIQGTSSVKSTVEPRALVTVDGVSGAERGHRQLELLGSLASREMGVGDKSVEGGGSLVNGDGRSWLMEDSLAACKIVSILSSDSSSEDSASFSRSRSLVAASARVDIVLGLESNQRTVPMNHAR